MGKRERQPNYESQFVRKALDVKSDAGSRTFYLVESYNGPSDGQEFRQELADNESFQTDFIGASEQDCRKWALEKQSQNGMIEQDIVAIADKRSASDDTLSMQFYIREPGHEFPKHGILPREQNKWHDFRVIYTQADRIYTALMFVAFDVVYPVYFGRKDELTNEHGIFDVDKAQELCTT